MEQGIRQSLSLSKTACATQLSALAACESVYLFVLATSAGPGVVTACDVTNESCQPYAKRLLDRKTVESEMGNYLTFFLGKLCNASKSRDILKSHAFVAHRGHPQVLIDTTIQSARRAADLLWQR